MEPTFPGGKITECENAIVNEMRVELVRSMSVHISH